MTVQYRDDQDALGLDEIDETVGPDQDLPKLRQLRVAKPMTAVSELCQRFRGIDGELRQAPRIRLRVPRDEFDAASRSSTAGSDQTTGRATWTGAS